MDHEQQIIDFLNGNLKANEIKAFEEKLKTHKEFQETYSQVKSMHIFLNKMDSKESFTKKMDGLATEYFPKETDRNKKSPKVKNIILFVLLFLIGSVILFLLFRPKDQSLYLQYAQHSPIHLIQKSINTELQAKIENTFNDGKFEESYTLLKEYITLDQQNIRARLAFGISALETGKLQEADQIFTEIKNGQSSLKHFGTWYLALLQLKTKDYARAKILLSQIPENENSLYRKSQNLHSEIEKLRAE